MKRNVLFNLLIFISFLLFSACNDDEAIADSLISYENELSVSELGDVMHYNSFDDYHSARVSNGINNLKNSTIDSFESMQKLYEYMEVLQEDSLKTDLFQMYLNKYKDFFLFKYLW